MKTSKILGLTVLLESNGVGFSNGAIGNWLAGRKPRRRRRRSEIWAVSVRKLAGKAGVAGYSGAGRAPATATAAHTASAAVGEGAKSSPAAPSADELAELDALVRQSDGVVVEAPAEAAIGTSGDVSLRSSGSELEI